MYLKIFYLRATISQEERKKNYSLKCQACKVISINKTKRNEKDICSFVGALNIVSISMNFLLLLS